MSRANSSQYACVVTNAVGSAYAKLLVEVEWPPKFTSEEAKEVEVVTGGDKWFDCGVDAKPLAAVRVFFNPNFGAQIRKIYIEEEYIRA